MNSLALLLFLLVPNICLSNKTEEEVMVPDPDQEDAEVRAAWIKIDKDLKSTMSKLMRKAMPPLMKEIYKKELDTQCLSALLTFSNALKQGKAWAFKMLDASGRLPEGFLDGALTSLGNYDECLNIRVNNSKSAVIDGQYCTLKINAPIPNVGRFKSLHGTVPVLRNLSAPDSLITYLMQYVHNLHVTDVRIGICFPSPCATEDMNKLMQILPEKTGMDLHVEVERCEVREELHFNGPQLAALYVLGLVMVLLVIGTCLDFCAPQMEDNSLKATLVRAARSFSLAQNMCRISDYVCPDKSCRFVHGALCVILIWTIASDCFMFLNYDTTSNLFASFGITQHLFYEVALNRLLPLQVFFYFSGLLTTYKWLKSPEQSLNVWKFLLKRYWRYTPAYGLCLALVVLTPQWGSGPSWYSHVVTMAQNCQQNWFYNLLYLNNFVGYEQSCLNHTWVFAVDAQLHLLAICVLIPLKLRPKIGLLVTGILAVASAVSVALTNVYYDLPPNEMLAVLQESDRAYYAEHSYMRVYHHIFLYCCGVLVAYFMHKNTELKIPRTLNIAMWAMTTAGAMTIGFVVHRWNSGIVPSPLCSALYATLSKIVVAVFLAWVTVCFMSGHGGPLRRVLSWRPFAFLSRLIFIAYIIHVPIISMVNAFKRSHSFITHIELFFMVMSFSAAALIVAYALHLCFEAPFISLAEVIRRRCKGRDLHHHNQQDQIIKEKPMSYAQAHDAKNNC